MPRNEIWHKFELDHQASTNKNRCQRTLILSSLLCTFYFRRFLEPLIHRTHSAWFFFHAYFLNQTSRCTFCFLFFSFFSSFLFLFHGCFCCCCCYSLIESHKFSTKRMFYRDLCLSEIVSTFRTISIVLFVGAEVNKYNFWNYFVVHGSCQHARLFQLRDGKLNFTPIVIHRNVLTYANKHMAILELEFCYFIASVKIEIWNA